MKKIIIIFLLFSVFGFSQKQYTFDHYAIYKGYNGYRNIHHKRIMFGNSKDHSYILEFGVNENKEVTSITLSLENLKKRIFFKITPFPFKDFNPEIHLKSSRKTKILSSCIDSKLAFSKNEVISKIDSTITTTISTYKKETNTVRKIEIVSFKSDKVTNQKVHFAHSNDFLNCNKISLLPNAIKSYKLTRNNKILESFELEELDATNFSINYKE
jgi:hypothetical protein